MDVILDSTKPFNEELRSSRSLFSALEVMLPFTADSSLNQGGVYRANS